MVVAVVGLVMVVLLSVVVLVAVALPHHRRGDRFLTAAGEQKVSNAVGGLKGSLTKRPEIRLPGRGQADAEADATPTSSSEPDAVEAGPVPPVEVDLVKAESVKAEPVKVASRPTPTGPEPARPATAASSSRPGGRGGADRQRRGNHRSPVFTGTHTVSAAHLGRGETFPADAPTNPAQPALSVSKDDDPLVKWSDEMLGPRSQPFAALDSADEENEAGHRRPPPE